MAYSPITSREIDGETVETVADFIFGGSRITADSDCCHFAFLKYLRHASIKAFAFTVLFIYKFPSSVISMAYTFIFNFIYLQYSLRVFLPRSKHLDSIFKSRDITLPTKVRLVKAVVFPVVVYGCESWTLKKAEC